MIISKRNLKRTKIFSDKRKHPFKPEVDSRGTEPDFAYSGDDERAVHDRWETDRMTQYR